MGYFLTKIDMEARSLADTELQFAVGVFLEVVHSIAYRAYETYTATHDEYVDRDTIEAAVLLRAAEHIVKRETLPIALKGADL